MIQKYFIFSLSILFSFSVFSQQLDTAKLNSYFDALEKNNKLMGSVAIAKKGKLIYRNAIGSADIENGKKADQNTIYGIGSISKSYTATLVLMAVEESKINLQDKLSGFFPQIVNAEKISIENLLQHRSGVPNFTDDSTYFKWYETKKSRQEILDFIANSGSDFKPDSISAYSNSNYVLLSFILEDLYDKSFGQLLEEKITKPLGLENTYLLNMENPKINESNSYHYLGTWEKSGRTHSNITLGAGGIFSTPSDLVKFSYALFSGQLINHHSLETMTTIKEGYGLGIFVVPFYDKKGYGHTGGIDGYSSVYAFFPQDSISYAFISNGNNYTINEVSIAVLSAVYEMDYEIPEFKKYEVNTKELERYVGSYSSDQIPLTISISLDGDVLYAQATGQSNFPLSPKAEHVFIFEPADIEMIFTPENNSLVLKQLGQEFSFVKKD